MDWVRRACLARQDSAVQWVSVYCLEQIGGVIPDVTDFDRRVLAQFALDPQVPGVNTIWTESCW